MLRTQFAFLTLLAALAAGGVACTADVDSGEDVNESQSAIFTTNPDLFGTYRGDSKLLGSLPLLVLKADGTYHRTLVVPCMPAGCSPMQDDGVYQLWAREGGNYISFYPDDGSRVDRFQYAIAGDTIRLRRMTERDAFHLHKTTDRAWCEEIRDCALQNLPVGPCGGGQWICMTSAEICRYSCYSPL